MNKRARLSLCVGGAAFAIAAIAGILGGASAIGASGRPPAQAIISAAAPHGDIEGIPARLDRESSRLDFTDGNPSLDFGVAARGQSKLVKLRIYNASRSTALKISRVRLSADAREDFSVESGCPLAPASVRELRSCGIAVEFKPSHSGRIAGKLIIEDNTRRARREIELSGTGA